MVWDPLWFSFPLSSFLTPRPRPRSVVLLLLPGRCGAAGGRLGSAPRAAGAPSSRRPELPPLGGASFLPSSTATSKRRRARSSSGALLPPRARWPPPAAAELARSPEPGRAPEPARLQQIGRRRASSSEQGPRPARAAAESRMRRRSWAGSRRRPSSHPVPAPPCPGGREVRRRCTARRGGTAGRRRSEAHEPPMVARRGGLELVLRVCGHPKGHNGQFHWWSHM